MAELTVVDDLGLFEQLLLLLSQEFLQLLALNVSLLLFGLGLLLLQHLLDVLLFLL